MLEKGSYLFEINLPKPIIVPPAILAIFYIATLAFDKLLIQNKQRLSVTTAQLYTFIGLYHFILPILFSTKYDFGNISFMMQPWIFAAQIIFLSNSNITLKEMIIKFVKISTFQDLSTTKSTSFEIRQAGLKKIIRGIIKIGFMKLVLDKLLPDNLSILLYFPVYSWKSLYITYLLAFRIYCMLSVTDILMGIVQCLFYIRFHDLFDNPFMAYSPMDFWNRRWNRLVSRLYHRFLFVKMTNKKRVQKYQSRNIFETPTFYGLTVFFISGLIHDFMIAAAARVITFELTFFFMIHGVAVAIEAHLCKRKHAPTGVEYFVCNLLTVLFFLITGRIFLNPILLHDEFLYVAQKF